MPLALLAVRASEAEANAGSPPSVPDTRLPAQEAPAPRLAAPVGARGIPDSEFPPDWDEEPPDPYSGDDYPPEDLQAEVALDWGFSAGLDMAFDD
jgi:hypothetical protein